jgi:hypothetical protein
MKGGMQFCCGGKYGVSPNGFDLPASNVEHGFGEGVVLPV